MSYRYALKDEESDGVIGHFDYISGLPKMKIDEVEDGDNVHLEFINFYFTNEFRQYCTDRSRSITNVYILILDNNGFIIGSYYYVLSSKNSLMNSELIDGQNVQLKGYSHSALFEETIPLWDLWRDTIPTRYNIWLNFSMLQRNLWLEIIRNYHNTYANCLQHQDETNQTFYLNGRNITDKTSFYFSLGEAVNGPGGYFGACLDSLSDCLSGGFGVIPPFSIEIRGYTNKSESIETILQVLREQKVEIRYKL